MRIAAATAIALGLQLLLIGSRSLEAQEIVSRIPRSCERLVEFRDGSILRLELPAEYKFEFRSVELGGSDAPATLLLESPLAIRFSKLPALRQLRVIQDAVTQLQVDNFSLRERALHTLVTGGDGFRPFLEDLFAGTSNPEGRWRLAAALKVLPPQQGIYQHAYDELTIGDQVAKGDVDDWNLAVPYRGTMLVLDRNCVRAIRRVPPLGVRGDTPIIATTDPIRKDLDALFPNDCTRIDFEFDSNGDPLRPGQDISRRFIPDGVIISTSVKDSFFSVNDFEVSSRSRGQSGATHLPLFHGTITLRFCVPGNENEPAGVTHVGLYAAVVQEGGTSFAAFDSSGHRIATVTTETGAHQFIGLRSNVPIHRVEIIPNQALDPDVTIDDLVFSGPEPIDAGGVGEGYTLDFSSGERLICKQFRLANESVIASPTGEFAGEIAFPSAELVRLQTPVSDRAPPDQADASVRFWTLLDDGSTLLARDSDEGQTPHTMLARMPLDTLPLTALWSENGDLAPFPADVELEESEIVTIATSEPTILASPVLTSKKFTAMDDVATVEYSYNRIPSIWLRRPNATTRDRASGFIRLSTGERLVFGKSSVFQLRGFDFKSITIMRAGREFQIPLDSITSLRLPTSK